MICPTCGGKGRISMKSSDRVVIEGMPIILPCPDCNQQGIAYCCEGESPRNLRAKDSETK